MATLHNPPVRKLQQNIKERAAAPLRIWLLISFLVGLGGAGTLCGFLRLFDAQFDPLPQTTLIALGAALFCLAVSPWLPQGVIRFVSSRVLTGAVPGRERDRGGSLSPLTAHAFDLDEDRELVLGTSCLLAGLSVLLIVSLVGPFRAMCDWLRADFFWTPTTLRMADLFVAIGLQFIPVTLIGLSLVCVLAVQDDPLPGRTSTMRMSALLWGVAVGVWAVMWRFSQSLTVPLTLVISSVPLFLAAVLTLLHAGRRTAGDNEPVAGKEAGAVEDPLPELSESGLGLLLTGLFFWTVTLTIAGAVWHRATVRLLGAQGVSTSIVVAVWIASMGIGAWLFRPRSSRASQMLDSGGLRLCLAGLSVGIAVAALGAVERGVDGAAQSALRRRNIVLAAIVFHGFCNGAVLPVLLRGALSRFATRGLAHARIMTTWAAAASITFLALVVWFSMNQGTLIAFCGCCLVLLIAGGTLVIYDPIDQRNVRRAKLVGVFACLFVLMFGLPWAAPRWPLDRAAAGRPALQAAGRDEEGKPGSANQVRDLAAGRSMQPDHISELLGACPPGSSVCLIGASVEMDQQTAPDSAYPRLRIEHWPHPVDAADPDLTTASLSRLRTERKRFDLVIYEPGGEGLYANDALWAEESLRRLAGLLTPTGIAVARVPVRDLPHRAIRILARTFHRAFDARAVWSAKPIRGGEPTEIWLIGTGRAPSQEMHTLRALQGVSTLRSVQTLLGPAAAGPIHSLEHPRLVGVFGHTETADRGFPVTLLAPVRE